MSISTYIVAVCVVCAVYVFCICAYWCVYSVTATHVHPGSMYTSVFAYESSSRLVAVKAAVYIYIHKRTTTKRSTLALTCYFWLVPYLNQMHTQQPQYGYCDACPQPKWARQHTYTTAWPCKAMNPSNLWHFHVLELKHTTQRPPWPKLFNEVSIYVQVSLECMDHSMRSMRSMRWATCRASIRRRCLDGRLQVQDL